MKLFGLFSKKSTPVNIVTDQKDIELTSLQIDFIIDNIARKVAGYSYCQYNDFEDPLFEVAAIFVVKERMATEKLLQQQFKINYIRAGRILDQLEDALIVSTPNYLSERIIKIQDHQALMTQLNTRKLLNKEFILDFEIEHKDEIDRRISYYKKLSLNEYKENKDKIQFEEIEQIKNKILDDRKKKEHKKQALSELKEEGLIENTHKREPIPQEVQDIVWNRDGGKCVKCGSQENLEFDHIIPFSKGGSNTARNLQLLCQKCNRSKSNIIG